MSSIQVSPPFIPVPFAQDGLRNEISLDPNIPGLMSWNEGMSNKNSTALLEGGIPPSRLDFNAIFNIITEHLYYTQLGGFPKWRSDVVFERSAIIKNDDDLLYQAKVENGPGTSAGIRIPDSSPDQWKNITFNDEITSVILELTELQEAIAQITITANNALEAANNKWTAVDASTTVKGIVQLATIEEVIAGTDTLKAATPEGVKAAIDNAVATTIQQAIEDAIADIPDGPVIGDATTEVKGIVELATEEEAADGTDETRVITPKTMKSAVTTIVNEAIADIPGGPVIGDASTTEKGIVQLSTSTTGTSETLAATESAVSNAYAKGQEGLDAANAAQSTADDALSKANEAITDVEEAAQDATDALTKAEEALLKSSFTNSKVFTSSGTWTAPITGTVMIKIIHGGGGGGTAINSTGFPGGCGGGYFYDGSGGAGGGINTTIFPTDEETIGSGGLGFGGGGHGGGFGGLTFNYGKVTEGTTYNIIIGAGGSSADYHHPRGAGGVSSTDIPYFGPGLVGTGKSRAASNYNDATGNYDVNTRGGYANGDYGGNAGGAITTRCGGGGGGKGGGNGGNFSTLPTAGSQPGAGGGGGYAQGQAGADGYRGEITIWW